MGAKVSSQAEDQSNMEANGVHKSVSEAVLTPHNALLGHS